LQEIKGIINIIFAHRCITGHRPVIYAEGNFFVVPDTEYVFYTLNSAGMDETAGRLLETDTLTALREYVLSALEMNSFLQKERIEHVNIPEREAYILCLHRESMDLIRKVWQSGMPFEKNMPFRTGYWNTFPSLHLNTMITSVKRGKRIVWQYSAGISADKRDSYYME